MQQSNRMQRSDAQPKDAPTMQYINDNSTIKDATPLKWITYPPTPPKMAHWGIPTTAAQKRRLPSTAPRPPIKRLKLRVRPVNPFANYYTDVPTWYYRNQLDNQLSKTERLLSKTEFEIELVEIGLQLATIDEGNKEALQAIQTRMDELQLRLNERIKERKREQ